MSNRNMVSGLGELMQIAFVPKDFDAAIQHWLKMGAGPFFVLKNNPSGRSLIADSDEPVVLDIALGNWGEMQIEVIRQVSGPKSIYSEWRAAGKEGVHHTCIIVDNMARAREVCAENGCDILHEGSSNGAEWLYADTHGGDGTLLEILFMPASFNGGLAAMTKAAAQNWDGSDPIRALTL